jgi:AdoMet-dependent heme synthase
MEHDFDRDRYRPRLIVWQLHPEHSSGGNGVAATNATTDPHGNPFTFDECGRTIESIARTAKPIVVLTGGGIAGRADLYDIVKCGVEAGLKMIVEAGPAELTGPVLKKYREFGPKIFRILVADIIVEDMHTRYRQSPAFRALEHTVDEMNAGGFEVHLSVHLSNPDKRALAFEHDYAMRRSVKGLYCHMAFEQGKTKGAKRRIKEHTLDEFIEEIAVMKSFSPEHMYFSPQCVKYGHRAAEHDGDDGRGAAGWEHWCLAGKTYAFIDPAGIVRACAGLAPECGNLRSNSYDFKSIWEDSDVFLRLRQEIRSCSGTRTEIGSSRQPQEDEK